MNESAGKTQAGTMDWSGKPSMRCPLEKRDNRLDRILPVLDIRRRFVSRDRSGRQL